MEHNQHFKYADLRRKFLKDLSKQLCMPSIEARLTQTSIICKSFTRNAMELVLEREVNHSSQTSIEENVPRAKTKNTKVIGRCNICARGKDQKTRKSCCKCKKPASDEHSVNQRLCDGRIEKAN